jgi:branched-chain amino acid transport system substrate-binding protein
MKGGDNAARKDEQGGMSMKKLLGLAALVPALLAGSAQLAAAEDVVFGASLPLTGGLATNGQKHKEGFELCMDLVNQGGGLLGGQAKLIVSDNQSSNDTGQAQIERLINQDKVNVLLGTFSSRITFAQTSVAEQNKMVYPVPSGVALQIYERGYHYIFNFQPNAAEYLGKSYLAMMKDLVKGDLPKTAAVVWGDDFYGNAAIAGLTGDNEKVAGTDKVIELAPGILADAGINVVLKQQWPEEGFSDWIGLANSVKQSGAEMVIGFTASPDEAIQLVRAFKTVNYQPQAAIMGQGTQSEFHDQLGDAANGVLIHAAWHPAVQWVGTLNGKDFSNQDFIDAFKAKFGKDPDEDNAIPFATCQGMVQAVAAVGSTDNTKIRDWLAARTADDPVKTILGNFHWDDKGLPQGKAFLITQWQGGELKFVYPTGQFSGTADLVWPKPNW